MQQQQQQHKSSASSLTSGKHTSRDGYRRGDTAQNASVTEFSLKGLASGARPDDVLLRIDHARRTTAVTLIYSHGPNGDLSLPFPYVPPSRPPFPFPIAPLRTHALNDVSSPYPSLFHCRNAHGQVTNDTAAPINLARLPNRSSSPCARGCPERIGGGRTQTTIPVPRPGHAGEGEDGRAPPLPRRSTQTAPPLGPSVVRSPERAAAASQAGSTGPASMTSARPTAAATAPSTSSANTAVQSTTRPAVGTLVAVKVEKGATSALPDALDAARPALARKRSTTVLRPHRHTHKIRNTTKRTTWYGPTESARALAAPPDGLRPARTWLYVHRYRAGAGTQVWMFIGAGTGLGSRRALLPSSSSTSSTSVGEGEGEGEGEEGSEGEGQGGWRVVYPGHRHPDLEGYVLHLLDSGEPRWVKEASAKTYACGKKLRQRMARYIASRYICEHSDGVCALQDRSVEVTTSPKPFVKT
ncbi:hypothetical protein C8Q79DRAFT_1006217 [Trametes meyenii]|nr:hypothetical protein C8Q79DRAFT_1006217 [Trametes meyenii]